MEKKSKNFHLQRKNSSVSDKNFEEKWEKADIIAVKRQDNPDVRMVWGMHSKDRQEKENGGNYESWKRTKCSVSCCG